MSLRFLGLTQNPTAPPSWMPTNDPELQTWFDMADATNYTAPGGIVAIQNDKSGLGHTATPGIGPAAPAVLTADKNGLNTFDFTNGGGATLGFGMGAVIDPAKPFAIYVVAKVLTVNSFGILLTVNGVGTNAPYFNLINNNEVAFSATSGQWASTRATVGTIGTTDYHIFAILYNGAGPTTLSNFSTYYDGVVQTTTSGVPDNGNSNTMASYDAGANNPSFRFNGAIAEIVVTQSITTYSDMANYLSTKWAIP